MNSSDLTSKIKDKAIKSGFELVGVSPAENNKKNENILNNWLDNGYHATMHWIENRRKERINIQEYFPNVKSVISLGYNYYTNENDLDSSDFKISNYAWGEDYHIVLKKKLYEIIKLIKNDFKEDFEFRVCVDTSPVLEKSWGQKAGLGWIGKHTNLINEKLGSWFFLSEIMLDFELDYNKPFTKDLCGTCTKCIDDCPTDAIIDDYKLDANKCISYLTIEHRNKLPKEFENKLDGWIYGCDICQQVCPWNIKFSKVKEDNNFNVRSNIEKMKNSDWIDLTKKDYQTIFSKSAIKRTKFEGLKRNITANKK